MKIEKITENKIRILLKSEDIHEKNIDLHTLMTKAVESQSFFLDILDKAEEEVGFNTDGYRLLIEAYSSPDEDFVFTITKYEDTNLHNDESSGPIATRKKAVPKKVRIDTKAKSLIYSFDEFEEFCQLCTYLNCSNIKVKGIAKSISLHKYNEIYYLLVKEINEKYSKNKNWFSIFSEFGKFVNFSTIFENKLQEHGNEIIKHNALNKGIKYFS